MNNPFILQHISFIPHGHCYLWKPELVGLHVLSDGLIALAYYSIPLMLIYFVSQRTDVPFKWIFWMFGAFIASCGSTHLMGVWTLWHPDYWLSGLVKALTAGVSLYTAVELFTLIPQALTLPSPEQLQATNEQLAQEILTRQQTEVALRESEARFRSIFENAAISIILADLDGYLLQVNSAFERMLGYQEDELQQMSYLSFTYAADVSSDQQLYENLVAGMSNSYQLEKRYVTKQDQIVWGNLTVSLLRDTQGQPQYAIAMIEDITERKKAEVAIQTLNTELEQRVKQRTSELQLVNNTLAVRAKQQRVVAILSQLALSGLNMSQLMAEMVLLVSQTLQVDYCSILETLPDNGMEWRAGAGWPAELMDQDHLTQELSPLAGYTLKMRQPIVIKDLSTETRFKKPALLDEMGVISGVSVVIAGHKQPDGIIGVYSRQARDFSLYDILFLQAVANVLAVAIERDSAETALRASEEKFRQIAENIREVFWMVSEDKGQIIYLSPAYDEVWGRPREQLYQQPDLLLETIHPEDQERFTAELLNFKNSFLNTEYRIIRPDGSVRWIWTKSFPVYNDAGQVYRLAGISEDITQRKEMEQDLFQEKQLAQVTLQSIGDAVMTTDAVGNINYLNPSAEKLTGWTLAEVKGNPLAQTIVLIDETTREPVINPVSRVFEEGQITGLWNHALLIAKDGHEYAIEDTASAIRTATGQILGAVFVCRDVTPNRHLARQLSWQASHDSLTGLANRREFESRLEDCLASTISQNQEHTLCYLDLDRFKIVNDTCGHIAGDELLRQVSHLLQTSCRKTDIIARLGGDEFALLLVQCPLQRGQDISQKLLDDLQEFRFIWEDKIFNVGLSIGLVSIHQELLEFFANCSADTLLSAADSACYAAKNRGRNRIYLYQPNDHEVAQQRREAQWVTRLQHACEHDQLCLYFQPIANLNEGAEPEEHYEVLLRLKDETGQIIPPMAFLPAAERYNLMPVIDRWVIRKFFTYLSQILKQEADSQNLQRIYAINVSGASVNDEDFIQFIKKQLNQYQVPATSICFEITETVAIASLSKAAQLIRELRSLGCRFSLDDFGSGMSSFTYLKNLPVNYLKIDGNFVRDMVDDPMDYAMVEVINHIGHVMELQTIAEFVANEAILEQIKKIGVDYAQGYGIALPQPLEVECSTLQSQF